MDESMQFYLLSFLAGKASSLIKKTNPIYTADEDCDGCYSDDSPFGVCMTDDCPDSYVTENGVFYLIINGGSHCIDIGGWHVEFCVPDQEDEIVAAILELANNDIIERRF